MTEQIATDAAPEPASTDGKSIVLFSDGTGNSSAKLFKTNVWRMYEAVDLGPPAPGKRPQISYYDDGVGTSSFKPLAALGGAFGWGLKRNVLDIYRFVCRNYRDRDAIYAFGFSRGAFTARLVVALIASEGLVRSDNEADLDRKSTAAYRALRQKLLPRRLQWPTKLARKIRDAFIAAGDRLRGRAPYDSSENAHCDIQFVGVWDTVSAYGGPITEITRAVDNWFFPLSMPDYTLHERVLCARHALALDDERDAFHPLLWDEVHEAQLVKDETVKPGRLQQVWFTGMHADVGGGYPDESLSYVSLLWMMEEAERAGLRTLTVIKDRILALASSFGPIHDSRAGVGSYYRYQPRRIAAWLNPVDDRTLSLRDPAVTDAQKRSRGLLRSVLVHESVINRIATGTDRYAPITLPRDFEVIPPQQHGENVPQADSDTPAPPGDLAARRPMVDWDVIARLKEPAVADARQAAFDAIWNHVWWRRIIYFLTLGATIVLISFPLVVSIPGRSLADGRNPIGAVIGVLTNVLPAWAGRWTDVYADHPFYFLAFAVGIWLLLGVGKGMERKLRDEARGMWRAALDGNIPPPRPSRMLALTSSPAYQRLVWRTKWLVLPDFVIGPLFAVLLAAALFSAYVHAALPFLENDTVLCQPSAAASPIARASRVLSPRDVCSESFGLVNRGNRYRVTFDVIDPWYDGRHLATPQGLGAGEFSWGIGYLAAPLKRVVGARFLQPLLEIRPPGGNGVTGGNVRIYPLAVAPEGDSSRRFRADFDAPLSGELFMFVNDAMLPFRRGRFDYRYFYGPTDPAATNRRSNRGSACVTVESVLPDGTPHTGPAAHQTTC